MRVQIVVTAILGVLLMSSSPSDAQGQFTCDPLPPDEFGVPCHLVGTFFDVELETVIDDVVVTRTGDSGWKKATACNCIAVPFGDPLWVESCPDVTFRESATTEWCWGVSGSISAEGRIALLNRLFGEIGLGVEIGGELSDCDSVTLEHELDIERRNCFDNFARILKFKREVTGRRTEAKVVKQWVCTFPDGDQIGVITNCGVSTVEASASTEVVDFQFAPHPPSCHGPDVGDPDPFDGQRLEPCFNCETLGVDGIVGCPDAGPELCCGRFGSS